MRSSVLVVESGWSGYRGATTAASWPWAPRSVTMRRTTVVTPFTWGAYVSVTIPTRTRVMMRGAGQAGVTTMPRLCNSLGPGLRLREGHADRRAVADSAARFHAPTVRLDEVLHDREAEPGPALGARSSRIGAVEALEDAGKVLGRDTGSGVLDRQQRGTTLALGRDRDPAARGRVAQRIVEQIGEDLAGGVGVGSDGLRRGADVEGELDPVRLRATGEGRPCLAGDGTDVDPLRCRAPASGLDARQVEQLFHQPLHAVRIVENDAGELLGLGSRRRLVGERFGVAGDRGQRRLQLVRHVRHEVAPDRFQAPELGDVPDPEQGASVGEPTAREQQRPVPHLEIDGLGLPAGEDRVDEVARALVMEQLGEGRRRAAGLNVVTRPRESAASTPSVMVSINVPVSSRSHWSSAKRRSSS